MINNELLGYIKNEITKGHSPEAIKVVLRGGGWSEADLQEAFNAINIPPNPSAPQASQGMPSTPYQGAQAVPVQPASAQANSVFTPINNFGNSPAINSFTQSSPVGTGKHKKTALVISIIIALLLAGGGAYAYYSGTFLSLPSLVSKSIDGTRSSNTAKYDTTITADLSEMKNIQNEMSGLYGGITSNKFSLTIAGEYDVSNRDNIKDSTTISVDAGALSAKAELRVVDNTLYGQIIKAPALGFLPVLSLYENKWVSFQYKKEGKIIDNPFTSLPGVNNSLIEKLTTDQKEHLYQISRDAKFVKMVKKFSPEEITGEESYHFSFDLDKEGIASYLGSLKDYIHSIGKDDSYLSSFDPTSLSKDLDKLKDFKGEIWIGRSDKLLRKIMVDFGIKPDDSKDEQIKINIVSIFSDWNKPVSIVAPEGSVSLEEFMSSPSGPLGQARAKGQDASIKSNLSSMLPEAELFYQKSNSYSGFCSSDRAKNIEMEIKAPEGHYFSCQDNTKAWAASSKLLSDAGYWCVDSTGASKQIATMVSTTTCTLK